MKRKTIGITFDIPSDVYYGLRKLLNMDTKTLNRLFSAAAINRFIQLGYLNEFGEPFEPPTFTISARNIDTNILEANIKEFSNVVNKE